MHAYVVGWAKTSSYRTISWLLLSLRLWQPTVSYTKRMASKGQKKSEVVAFGMCCHNTVTV